MIYYLILAFALISAFLESVSYYGFIENKLGFPSLAIYLLSFIISIFYFKQVKVTTKIFKIILIITSIIYAFLIALETYFYPNYIYSNFHINPAVTQFALAFLSYHLTLHLNLDWYKALLFASLIYVLVDGSGRTLGLASRGLGHFVSDPSASYETKLARVYPGFYETMKEIVEVTPANSTIFIPPQSNPWELEGNGAMVRYFVYPRQVRNLSDDLFVPKVDGPAYVLVARGSAKQRVTVYDYGWPKSTFTGKKVWKLIDKKKLVLQPDSTYIYDPDNLWDWGLIEVYYAQ
ncbi:MAG: hypothetical protein Fur0011_7400 [Candidatus Microgenomates bacterium]